MNQESLGVVASIGTNIPLAAVGQAGVHVLVVDDDPQIRQLIVDYLGDYDIRVATLETGRDVTALLERESIDLVILDMTLPGENGLHLACRLRAQFNLPIVMITGRKDEADRVMALELGVDDYLTKPFSPRELVARIRALLRRANAREAGDREPILAGVAKIRVYRFAGWELNVRLRRLLSPDGRTLPCTNGEFNLLIAFLSSPDCVLSREQLLDLSRLYNDEVYDRSVDVQVGRLRKKLQPTASGAPLIRTERGAGYVFIAAVDILR